MRQVPVAKMLNFTLAKNITCTVTPGNASTIIVLDSFDEMIGKNSIP